MNPPVFRIDLPGRRLIALIGVGLVCLLCEAKNLEASCGDWLASHSQSGISEAGISDGTPGTINAPSGSCGCKGLRCRPGNTQGNLPTPEVRLFDGNWGVIPGSEDPAVLNRVYRLGGEPPVYAISFATSIFHPPRSV